MTQTKTEIIETHWQEFLQHVKDNGRPPLDWEDAFWWYYVENKMETVDAQA